MVAVRFVDDARATTGFWKRLADLATRGDVPQQDVPVIAGCGQRAAARVDAHAEECRPVPLRGGRDELPRARVPKRGDPLSASNEQRPVAGERCRERVRALWQVRE